MIDSEASTPASSAGPEHDAGAVPPVAQARRPNRSLRGAAVAVGLVTAFWVVAATARGFVDRPFDYWARSLYASNFAYSQARFLTPVEAALEITGAALLFPAVLIAAVWLARRFRCDPFEVIDSKVGDGGWRFVAVLAAVACAGAAFIAFGVLQSTFLLDDERAYAFQARLFASGHVGLPPPPAAFRNPMLLIEPQWTSKYPPGHSLLLTMGSLLGDEHIVPVVLAPALVVCVYSFVRDAFGERQGRLAATLTAISPLVWANYGTLAAWTTTSCAFALFLVAFVRAERSGRAVWAFAAGAAMAVIGITRPSECAGLSIPFALAWVWSAVRGTRRERTRLLAAGLGFASLAWIVLWHDRAITGSAWKLPYLAAGPGEAYRMGFVAPWPGHPRHTPAAAVANLVGVLARLDLWLFAWPGSMALVALGVLRRSKNRYDRLLLASLGTFLVGYAFIFSTGTWDTGPTYYVVLLPLLVALAVRGLQTLRRWLIASSTGGAPHRATGWIVSVGAVVAWVTVVPIHFVSLGLLAREVRLPWEAIASADIGDAAVALPSSADMHPAGWAYGYPYEISTGPATHAQLFRPSSLQGLYDAVKYLGRTAVYTLESDDDAWAHGRHRAFRVVPLKLKPGDPAR